MIGSCLVRHLQENPEFSSIILLLRKPLGLSGGKLTEKIVDFRNLPEISSDPKNTIVFCSLGTTIKNAGSQEKFEEADLHAPLALAQLAAKCGFETMVSVSSLGADAGSSNFYLRTKGKMQEGIMATGLKKIIFVQPSLLTGNRKEFRLGEKIAIISSSVWKWLLWGPLKKYRPIEANVVAMAMVRLSLKKENGIHIVGSDQLQIEGKI